MFYKALKVILGCFILTSCNAFQSLESENAVNNNLDEGLGFGGTEYQVPDYYSTQHLDKSHQVGQTYYVKDLRCDNRANRCTY